MISRTTRRRAAGRLALGLVGWLALAAAPARGHAAFAEYVWHRVELQVAGRNIDVFVELTFFEEWSERERRIMDLDADGRTSRAEIERYARTLEPALESQLSLHVGGRRVPLIALYSPELDLPGGTAVEGGHHQLRLRFFATAPESLAPGTEIVLEDRLWPEARCLPELARTAANAGRLEAGKITERPFPAASHDALRFSARYVEIIK